MDDAAIRPFVLKMEEPPFARGCVDQSTLMRAVDRRSALSERHLALVRSVNAVGPEGELPARRDAAGRGEDVVITVELVEFWPLDRRVGVVPVKDHYAVVEQPRSVGAHPVDDENALDAGPAAGESMHEIRLAVVVPERARVDPALGGPDEQRPGPFAGGILGLCHKYAEVRIAVINVIFAVMVPDRRSPDAAAVLRSGKNIGGLKFADRVIDDPPVYKVL